MVGPPNPAPGGAPEQPPGQGVPPGQRIRRVVGPPSLYPEGSVGPRPGPAVGGVPPPKTPGVQVLLEVKGEITVEAVSPNLRVVRG